MPQFYINAGYVDPDYIVSEVAWITVTEATAYMSLVELTTQNVLE